MQAQACPGRLVIVDDDPHVLSALQFAFQVEGYAVQTYKTGEEVLDALPHDAVCIIMDENLPGISGLQATTLLRHRGLSIPIIVITTCPSPALRSHAERCHAEIVEKPLLGDGLALRVRRLVSSSETSLKHG